MTKNVNLRGIKIKAYRTILEDGLIEIALGIYLVLSGIFLFHKSFILNYIWLPFALVLIDIIRRRYVFPRTGYVKISLSTREIITIFGAIIFGVGILTALIAFISAGLGQTNTENWQTVFSSALIIFTVVFFCFLAYRFNMPRWYFHGIMIGIVFFVSKIVDAHGFVVALGAIITIIGFVVLVRTLQRSPTLNINGEENLNAR